MSEDTNIYMVQVTMEYGHVISMQFTNRKRAAKASNAIGAEIGKGKFRNESPSLKITSDACTYTIDTSRALSVCMIDNGEWNRLAKISQDKAEAIGAHATGVQP